MITDLLARGLGGQRAGTGVPTRSERRRLASRVLEAARDYPDQMEAIHLAAVEQRVAVSANRRAGKTEGVGRFTLGRSIARDDWSCVIVASTLSAPTHNWIDRPGGLLEVVDGLGLSPHLRVRRQAQAVVDLRWPWGSSIRVISAGSDGSWDRHRGITGVDCWWLDEAQSLTHLAVILRQLISPTLADSGGSIIATGTPGTDTDSLFARVCQGASPAWTVKNLASWLNPAFGDGVAERWAHLLRNCAADYDLNPDQLDWLRGLTPEALSNVMDDDAEVPAGLHADVQRELLGRWVSDAGLLVYPAWLRAEPWRTQPATLAEALRLPAGPRWTIGIGYDVGMRPDPAAWVLLAWRAGDPAARVVWSEARHDLDDDQTLARTWEIVGDVQAAGHDVGIVVADFAGPRAGTLPAWRRHLGPRMRGMRVVQARKAGRLEQIRALNLDISQGRVLPQSGDPLDLEARHLRWSRSKVGEVDKHRPVSLPDGSTTVPGDHCLDSLRYLLPYSRALGERRPEPDDGRSYVDRRHDEAEERMLRGTARSRTRRRR